MQTAEYLISASITMVDKDRGRVWGLTTPLQARVGVKGSRVRQKLVQVRVAQ